MLAVILGLVNPSQSSPGEEIVADKINVPVNQLAAVINGNVETANIADGAITSAKIASGSIGNSQVADGVSVQTVGTNFAAVATGTTVLPVDDTIPQNTEGIEFMTQAITPKSTTNKLVIEATLYVCPSTAENITAALFQDSTANALAAINVYQATANAGTIITIRHEMTAGTTSATTFKIRAGMNGAGTLTFNGSGGARRFGAITKSNIKITEYKAS